MAGKGEVFQRKDGKWSWRLKAANGQIVATDGGQGYEKKSAASTMLQRVMSGHYDGPVTERS